MNDYKVLVLNEDGSIGYRAPTVKKEKKVYPTPKRRRIKDKKRVSRIKKTIILEKFNQLH